MLRLRAFSPTNDKIVKIQLHPTHPWLVTADASDHVSVWNWEHRQVIYELKAGGVDERRLVGAKLEKLAEGESEPRGRPTEAIRGGSMEFLCRSAAGDGPLVAFGGSDGVIRVLSMLTWKLARRYTGGHKGSIACLMTFMASSGEALSGGSDGLLVLWNADYGQDSRELVPKLSLKVLAHDGGVVAIELSRVVGAAPQLITIGADKTLAIWDTISFKELRRMKPVSKLACHSVASWCHPRAPNLDILTCVKDSHIWAIEHPTYSALTRPLCELSSLVPPQLLASQKKLRVYSMVAHPLQPHLVATGTNMGVLVCEFDSKSLPPVAPLPTTPGSREHAAVYVVERELKLLQFQLSNTANPALGSNGSLNDVGRVRGDAELHVKQVKKHISTPVPHDSYSVLSVSSSGKFVAIVWPDIPYFSVYKVSDWSIVDSGSARLLAWDTCRDRFALLESALPPRMPIIPKGSSSRKQKEAAAAAAQAAAAAASAASSASVQVRILLDDGTSNIDEDLGVVPFLLSVPWMMDFLHKNLLLKQHLQTSNCTAGKLLNQWEVFFLNRNGQHGTKLLNIALLAINNILSYLPYVPSFDTWEMWQFHMLLEVFWHRRQLFVATPTTIECVFVDAGIAPIDIETKKRKEEMRLKEVQSRAVAEHGELALITVDNQQTASQERIALRPPMLQVVRLASFQHAPSIPLYNIAETIES
ncbi:UNVERIFIED_CONTAM: TSET complex member tstF [Sesamum radiatum]|uniref:TSET complex member tstF n=1 Tax=Sesamum radiatum TaxID=300843 RepID=A0AAW2U840_SESRA